MNGIWKEHLGGYDKKGIRRKKQSRKHILKDKYYGIEKAYWKENKKLPLTSEGDVEEIISSEITLIHSVDFEVWSIKVSKFVREEKTYHSKFLKNIYAYSTRIAYFAEYKWYDYFSDELIIGDLFKKINFLKKEHFHFQNPLKIKAEKKYHIIRGDNPKKFIYGKPVPFLFKDRYKVPSGVRKDGRKIVNHRDRSILREYIYNADWDSVIKTHRLSKDFHFFYYYMY